MTFGETMQKLRKEAGGSQEECAERLGVSRQAISKWERDQSLPELEKMLRIGQIFGVSVDMLLGSAHTSGEPEQEKQPQQAQNAPVQQSEEQLPFQADGIPLTREMAYGYFKHQTKQSFQISLAVGVLVGSLAFSFWEAHAAMLLSMAVMIFGAVLLAGVFWGRQPYRQWKRQPLILEEELRKELEAALMQSDKKLRVFYLTGILLTAFGLLFCPLLIPAADAMADDLALSAGMILAGIGIGLWLYAALQRRTYRRLFQQEKGRGTR